MKTTQTTDTYTISITDINLDCDNPSRLEFNAIATLTRSYLESIHDADIVNDILDDTLPSITYSFNIASRHHDCLYASFDQYSGDSFDDYQHAVSTFGQPIIDFIDNTCQLLNIPFYPTR